MMMMMMMMMIIIIIIIICLLRRFCVAKVRLGCEEDCLIQQNLIVNTTFRVYLQYKCSDTVCGTAGEGFSLTVDERKQLAERWVETCRGRYKCAK